MNRGISPVISYVMVIAIVLASTMAAYMWALPLSKEMGEKGRITNLKSQMIGLDYVIRSTVHGDINFQNQYEMYFPDCFLYLDEGNNSIKLVFTQNTGVFGTNGSEVSVNVSCNASADHLLDNATRIIMFREHNTTHVFRGAIGPYAGTAEIAICYPDVDLQFGNKCSKGKNGPFSTILIRKTGFTTKPVIEIDIC